MVVVTGTAVLARRYVPESPVRTPGRVNVGAAVLIAAWLVALLVPLSQPSAWGWTSARTLGLLAVAVLALAGWVAVEVRSATPLIDMRMMRLPAVWTTNLVALLFGAQTFGVCAFLPQFVQLPVSTGYGFGNSVTVAGLLLLPLPVTMSVTGVLSGRIVRVLPHKRQLVLASGIAALGWAARGWPSSTPPRGRWPSPLAGHRLRAGLLRADQPDRAERPGPPDRRGQRHEPQHPHHRRRAGHRPGEQRRHRLGRRRRTARRVRLTTALPRPSRSTDVEDAVRRTA